MLGARLAEAWKFPSSCRLVAGFHHNPQTLEGDHLLLWLVHVADTLCAQGQQGFNLTALHQKLDMSNLARYKIDPILIEYMRKNLDTIVNSSSPLL
jgi:HD-like signal output (HDOD) protein